MELEKGTAASVQPSIAVAELLELAAEAVGAMSNLFSGTITAPAKVEAWARGAQSHSVAGQ